MDAIQALRNSYITINNNFSYYKKNYGHIYYSEIKDDEIGFIDKIFNVSNEIVSSENKMLNYSVSVIFTATAVLEWIMRKKRITCERKQLNKICKGYSNIELIDFSDKSEEELEEILFSLLTDGIDLASRKKSGSERTPSEIINYMLDLIQYKGANVIGKIIVDPACGTGTFIAQIMDRFLCSVTENYASDEIIEMLTKSKLVRAYDTKPSNVYITKLIIVEKLIRNNVIRRFENIEELMSNLPVICGDFLKSDCKADYVIGNPPYIRLQNLPNEYRRYIKDNYISATGRFDIYVCFIEKANEILKTDGKMCLITSNKYLTANYGSGIRKYLSKRNNVVKIVDLFDTKFFGAAVLPAITLCINMENNERKTKYIGVKRSGLLPVCECKNTSELFELIEKECGENKLIVDYESEENSTLEISYSSVDIPRGGKTWNFASTDENNIKEKLDAKKLCCLGDIMDICVGVKTTADSIFVKPMTEEFVKQQQFETETIYPLIQSFDVSKWNITWGEDARDRYILYPHREICGNMQAIPLEEIPHAKEYFIKNQKALKARNYLLEAKSREWYECWVPQKLSKFQQKKIITRDIVSHNSFAFDNTGKICQGNTFFLTRKNSVFAAQYSGMSDEMYYLFMLGVLNCKTMEFYQKMISGCLYSQKYRYTTSNLKRWPVPRILNHEAIEIAKCVSCIVEKKCIRKMEKEIDEIVYDQFDLKKEEIERLEDFIQIEEE